jgi:hypothetical protein
MNVEAEFQRTIDQWESKLFTDSPQGRSIFAAGAVCVLRALEEHCDADEWEAVREDFVTFAQAYMKDSPLASE